MANNTQFVTRFAPSPSGRMHAGNIFASLVSWLVARKSGGKVILRIEDLDKDRSKPEFIEKIQFDYEFLGLEWDEGPFFQSNRDEIYHDYFEKLCSKSLVYPCFCSRADLISSAPHFGEKQIYAGTCRGLSESQIMEKSIKKSPSYRLIAPDTLYSFEDVIQGNVSQNLAHECGDFLIKRSDGAFAYQLAVVVDDALQGVNCVVRGVDLLVSTPQQIYLCDLFGFNKNTYAHVPLMVSGLNKRLSKRDKSASIDEMLSIYKTPQGIIGHIAYIGQLQKEDVPAWPSDLLDSFSLTDLKKIYTDSVQIIWK